MKLPKDPLDLTPKHLERAIAQRWRLQKQFDDLNNPNTERGDRIFREIMEIEDLIVYLAENTY